MRTNAWSISALNSAAAVRLRSRYQSVAERSSVLAAGWKLALRAEPGMHLCSDLLPRNRLDCPRVDLPHAPFDLLGPCRFDVGLGFRFEALEKKASKLCPLALGELRCLSVKILKRPSHRGRLYPGSPDSFVAQRFAAQPRQPHAKSSKLGIPAARLAAGAAAKLGGWSLVPVNHDALLSHLLLVKCFDGCYQLEAGARQSEGCQ
jgi:hypothetical protein